MDPLQSTPADLEQLVYKDLTEALMGVQGAESLKRDWQLVSGYAMPVDGKVGPRTYTLTLKPRV